MIVTAISTEHETHKIQKYKNTIQPDNPHPQPPKKKQNTKP